MTVTSFPPVYASAAPQVYGLDGPTQAALDEMFVQWQRKLPRNITRMIYLDAKNKLQDLKIALPPEKVDQLDVVLGWPEKAVYESSNRIVWERLTHPDGEEPYGLEQILRDNRFRVEFPQAVTSSLAQSVSFVTATPGDRGAGQPDPLIMFHSALWATALWDRSRRALSAGLLINDVDSLGSPTKLTILLPYQSVVCSKGVSWYVEAVIPHHLGRVPMEMLPFRPTLDRPFGRSRIDRTVMSLTDRAVRAGARLEIHSELFSAMKLILMGADESTFTDQNGNKVPLWTFYMGRLNALTKDEDGDFPKLEKITAESPEPHIATLRQLSAQFSGHTGVPLSSLGIATDNVESADSKREARDDIINDAEKQQVIYEDALLRTFENAVMLRDRLTEPPADFHRLGMKWRRPDRPTITSLANAGVQQLSAMPQLSDTEVGMELVGLDSDQIVRARDELRRRAVSSSVLERLAALRSAEGDEREVS